MKNKHRRLHAVIWVLLLPALLGFLYLAQKQLATPAPTIEQAPTPSQLGELP